MGVAVLVSLLLVGLVVGGSIERKHFRNLEERERASRLRETRNDRFWRDPRPVARVDLALGSVVVATDPFKQFLATWRMVFGGELRSYASLVERARREAVQRMKESQPHADLFLNVRFETSAISLSARQGPGTVEVFAYGTAIRFARTLDDHSAGG